MSIKIHIIPSDRKPEWVGFFISLKPYLKKYDIIFTSKDEADIIICDNLKAHDALSSISHKKFIVVETCDCATVWSVKYLKLNNVIALIKGTILNPPDLNNIQLIKKRYHVSLLNGTCNKQEPARILSEQMKKVHCLLPYCVFYQHILKKYPTPFSISKRSYDISYLGTNKYAIDLITNHRLGAINAIKKLKNVRIKTSSRRIPREEFHQILMQSKLFLSPFGYGEWSHKDFEAILLGCVIIKPSCHFESYPNIYQPDKTCLKCKCDYSDLQAVVSKALNQPEKLQIISQNARELLKKYMNYPFLASEFQTFLKSILQT